MSVSGAAVVRQFARSEISSWQGKDLNGVKTVLTAWHASIFAQRMQLSMVNGPAANRGIRGQKLHHDDSLRAFEILLSGSYSNPDGSFN